MICFIELFMFESIGSRPLLYRLILRFKILLDWKFCPVLSPSHY